MAKPKRRITPDKWKHFYYGIIMGGILQGFLSWVFPNQLAMVTLFSFILVVAISYGFELFSKLTGLGHYDIIDAVASIIGGVLGMALVFVFIMVILT